MLRQLGDSTLHSVAAPVDFSHPAGKVQVLQQVDILHMHLDALGLVGIASNQCPEINTPLRIMIIGTNNQDSRQLAASRYPDRDIPFETLMINPKIHRLFGRAYYPVTGEGCGSFHCSLRARVKRFTSVEVEFSDIDGHVHHEIYHDMAAHIVQHEAEHLEGIVFFQKIMSELTPPECQQLIEAAQIALEHKRYQQNPDNVITQRHLAFERDTNGTLILDLDKLKSALHTAPESVLRGILFMLEG